MLSGTRRCVCFHSVILQKETGNHLMVLFCTPWWWSSKTIGALMIVRLVPWETKCWCLSYGELGNYSSNHSPVPSQVAFCDLAKLFHLPAWWRTGSLVKPIRSKLPAVAVLPVSVPLLSMVCLCLWTPFWVSDLGMPPSFCLIVSHF